MSIDALALAKRYLELRDARTVLKRKYEAADAVLLGEQDAIGVQFTEHLRAANLTSMRTEAGTIMLTERIRYWPSDWSEMYKFITEHDAYHLLEKRLHVTNMTEFLKDHPGVVPQGLNTEREWKASVRTKSD